MSGKECILARIDVVAFSKLSEVTHCAGGVFDSVEAILSASNEKIRRLNASCKKDLRLEHARLYGDTIDIWFKTGECDSGLILMMLDITAEVQKEALKCGLFVKGAIVRGPLRITDNAFTGQAMVSASSIENSCKFPCIVIDKAVMRLIDDTAVERFRTDQDAADFKTLTPQNREYIHS